MPIFYDSPPNPLVVCMSTALLKKTLLSLLSAILSWVAARVVFSGQPANRYLLPSVAESMKDGAVSDERDVGHDTDHRARALIGVVMSLQKYRK